MTDLELTAPIEWGQEAPKPNSKPNVGEEVIKDLRSRMEHGKSKYETYLQPFNGRRALKDLYEELLDATQYIKQLLMEEESCRICSRSINMTSWKGTNHCSIICEKIESGEITIEKAVELGVFNGQMRTTELYKDQCAHCKGYKESDKEKEHKKVAEALQQLPGWTQAIYVGRCGQCYEFFKALDTSIKFVDEGKKGYWKAQCCATEQELKDAGIL